MRIRPARLLREALLSVGAVVGVVCIVLAIGTAFFDVRPLLFRSGSMSPAITTGALAIAHEVPASELEVGDVVTVRTDGDTRVTHRIVSISHDGDQATVTLKGDANASPDAQKYAVDSAPRVWFDVPRLGYVVAWLAKPLGLVLLGAYAMFLLMVVLGRTGPRTRPTGGARRSTGAAAVAVLVVGVGASGLSVARTAPTDAAWTDTVGVAGTTLATYTVPKPQITSCTVTGSLLSPKTARIIWTDVSSPHALDYTATIVETGQSLTVVDQGPTRRTDFSAGLLSAILNQTYNIRITARLPAPNGSWVSVNANQPVTIGTLGLTLTCGTAT
jgi:signal peptidase I